MVTVVTDQNEREQQEVGDLGATGEITAPAQGQESAQQQLSSAGTMVTPEAASAAQTGATAGKGSAAGARFKNLRKYISKNVQPGIAQKITQQTGKQQAGLQADIGRSQAQFEKNLAAEQQRIGGGEQLLGDTEQKAQEFFRQGAAQYAQDPSKVQEFAGYRQGQAKQFQRADERGFQQRQADLARQARQAGTEQGRFGLLRETMGRGRQYGTGASRLDQLLLQSQAPEVRAMEQMGQTLGQTTGQDLARLQAERAAGQEEISGRAGALQQRIQEGFTGEQTRTQEEITGRQQAQREALNRIARGEGTQEDIQEYLGMEKGARTYGVDVGKRLTAEAADLTREEVAQQAELYRLNALATLGGTEQQFLGGVEDAGYREDLAGQLAEAEKAYTGETGEQEEQQKMYADRLAAFEEAKKGPILTQQQIQDIRGSIDRSPFMEQREYEEAQQRALNKAAQEEIIKRRKGLLQSLGVDYGWGHQYTGKQSNVAPYMPGGLSYLHAEEAARLPIQHSGGVVIDPQTGKLSLQTKGMFDDDYTPVDITDAWSTYGRLGSILKAGRAMNVAERKKREEALRNLELKYGGTL